MCEGPAGFEYHIVYGSVSPQPSAPWDDPWGYGVRRHGFSDTDWESGEKQKQTCFLQDWEVSLFPTSTSHWSMTSPPCGWHHLIGWPGHVFCHHLSPCARPLGCKMWMQQLNIYYGPLVRVCWFILPTGVWYSGSEGLNQPIHQADQASYCLCPVYIHSGFHLLPSYRYKMTWMNNSLARDREMHGISAKEIIE